MSTTHPTHPTQRSRRWSALLTWHLGLVVLALAVFAVAAAAQLQTAAQVAAGAITVLGLPWSVLLPAFGLDLGPLGGLWSAVPFLAPLLDVAAHWALLTVRSRRRRGIPGDDPGLPGNGPADGPTDGPATHDRPSSASPARRQPASRVLLFGACALVGAALWGAWLGWDTTYYTTPDVPHPQGPYTPVQVVACAVSVGLVTALLARWRNPLAVAAGITFGFWVTWSAQAAAGPLSGPFWPIGSFLLLCGLVAGTGASAALGFATRVWVRPRRGSVPWAPDTVVARDRWRTGTALVVVGGAWLLVGAVVRLARPLTWTFLQPLHVPLDLVAGLAVGAGAVVAVVAARRRRARGGLLRPLLPTAALAVVLLAVVLAARLVPADDGYSGQVGVMAGPDGAPVAVLGVCRGAVDALVVEDLASDVADRAADRGETAEAARLERDGAVDGAVQVDLTRPPEEWSGTPLRAPSSGEGELNITATGPGLLMNDTYFTRDEVRRLSPGMVTYSVWDQSTGYAGNEQRPLADFAAVACSGRGRYP